ncbi:MAG: hypothetical protein CMF41_03920 [Legionellales bacterium]|jgi:hypothetical protein|nr:hypothetical protein [Legionellales bacterium]OUX65036.1 MAG: hypothetical protein CBE41_02205 [Gammaproteobacteria bacterium TMED281]|tara:strand:+ start:316 stop:621 length:306 start_codon:yes stop_codon:yes gene_type:complete
MYFLKKWLFVFCLCIGCMLAFFHPFQKPLIRSTFYKIDVIDTSKSFYLTLKSKKKNPKYENKMAFGPYHTLRDAHQALNELDVDPNATILLKQLPIIGKIE